MAGDSTFSRQENSFCTIHGKWLMTRPFPDKSRIEFFCALQPDRACSFPQFYRNQIRLDFSEYFDSCAKPGEDKEERSVIFFDDRLKKRSELFFDRLLLLT